MIEEGETLFAQGYRLHRGPKTSVWNERTPEEALAFTVMDMGFVVMSEAERLLYVTKQ